MERVQPNIKRTYMHWIAVEVEIIRQSLDDYDIVCSGGGPNPSGLRVHKDTGNTTTITDFGICGSITCTNRNEDGTAVVAPGKEDRITMGSTS